MGTNDLMCPHYTSCPAVRNYMDKNGIEEQISLVGNFGSIYVLSDETYHCRVLELNNESREHPKHQPGIPERCAFLEQLRMAGIVLKELRAKK